MRLGFLRDLVLENWGLKLLSLAFAVLLWMFVVGEKRSEVSLSLPLELTRVPQDMVIVSRVPEAIRVRLNGPRSLLAGVNPNQLVVRLDLDGIQPGISGFEILPSRLNLPRGVEVTYISPSVITLEADAKARKVVAVRPRLRGAPAEGFEVAALRVDPEEVEVEGAQRVVQRLQEVPTELLDVTGLDGSFTRPLELAFPDPSLRAVGRGTVRVEATIVEMRGDREFVQVPVRIPAPGLGAVPAAVNVKLEGPVRVIARLSAADLTVELQPVGPEPLPGPAWVRVVGPAGTRVVSVEPEVVLVAPLDNESPARSGPATDTVVP
ncbi:MAG: CdaR family protein [Deferrisomatales bacterium]|nr:CdaR family protein [Deferrisomatales bacterium]